MCVDIYESRLAWKFDVGQGTQYTFLATAAELCIFKNKLRNTSI